MSPKPENPSGFITSLNFFTKALRQTALTLIIITAVLSATAPAQNNVAQPHNTGRPSATKISEENVVADTPEFRTSGILSDVYSAVADNVVAVTAAPVTVNSTGADEFTPTATDNDYTRIANAVNAATSGTVITLHGTFHFDEPNALASWANGNDGMSGTLDDYSVLGPNNLNNVKITSSSLGDAIIQGPGDLPVLFGEGVFQFYSGGTNKNWTISNIRFVGFDSPIFFFHTGGPIDEYSGTKLLNNEIYAAADNPADGGQTIGIHLSFGTGQQIDGNKIFLNGDGVSDTTTDPANPVYAAEVALQSNTSGGAVYDGLQITNNTVKVLNAQSADPEVAIGIWENGHAHLSNITVSGNQFVNMNVGNNPTANLQRGFRVTSQASTVNYLNNSVSGANIGFQWLSSSPATPVNITGNTVVNNNTGFLTNTGALANLSFNRIVGNTVAGIDNTSGGTVTAENNWWGCNSGPGNAGCSSVLGTVGYNPWLVLDTTVSSSLVAGGGTSTVTADLTKNSDGATPAGGFVPDTTPVTFSATGGTISPTSTTLTNGKATATFTAGNTTTTGTALSTVDNETQSENIAVDATPPTVSSVTRFDPLSASTNATTVKFKVTFSEPVNHVDQNDFALSTTGTVNGAFISNVSPTTTTDFATEYTVTVMLSLSAGSNGTLRLDVIDNGTIFDAVGNQLGGAGAGNGGFNGGETYTLDAIAPTVTINPASGQAASTSTSPVNFTVTFTEPTTNFVAGDVVVATGTGTAFGTGATPTVVVTGSGTTYNVAVSGMNQSGSVTATIPVNAATDAAGNGNSNSASSTVAFTLVNNTVSVNPTNTKPAYPNSTTAPYWFFANEGANGTGSFVPGPATPPLNTGSVRLQVDGTGRENIATQQFAGTRFADITELRYSTYQNNAANPNGAATAISLQFDVDDNLNDPDTHYQGRLVYEPYQNNGGTVPQNSWNEWNTLNGLFYGSNGSGSRPVRDFCVNGCTRAQLLTQFPNLGVRFLGTGDPNNGAFLLRAGGPYAGGFDGNADKLVIGINSSNTTFDFEPIPPTVSIDNAATALAQNEGNIGVTPYNFTVTLSQAAMVPVTVHVQTADGSATTADGDYTAVNTDLTFNPGDLTKTVTVNVTGDTKFEGNDSFTINLSNPVNTAIASGTGSRTGTITNDDPAPTVSVNDVTGNETNSGTTPFNFNVSLSNPSSQPITVYATTADGTAKVSDNDYLPLISTGQNLALAGTASQSSTYQNGPAFANRANDGNTDGDYYNNSVAHTESEFQPYWQVDLGSVQPIDHINVWNRTDCCSSRTANYHVFVSDVPFTGTTVADSLAQPGVQDNFNTPQAGTPTAVGVNRTGRYVRVQLDATEYLHLAEVEVIATTASSQAVTFAPGETSKIVTVNVVGDTKNEPNEDFTVNVSDSSNNILDSGTGTITNDDAQPKVSVVNTSGGAEPSTPNVFTVTLSGTSSTAVSVDYATASGTATQGSDYTGKTGTITFAANTTTLSQTVSVATIDDLLFEGSTPEDFKFTLLNPSSNTTIDTTVNPNPAIGTITDDDTTAPTVQFAPATYSVAENVAGGKVTLTVTRTGAAGDAFTVPYTLGVIGDTATGGTTCGGTVDYVNTGGILSFAANDSSKSFDVPICPDSVFEANETFKATLGAPDSPAVTASPTEATVTITNDDPAPTVAVDDVTHSEGNIGTTAYVFTVSLSNPSDQSITANVVTADDTATVADSDYTAVTTSVTFAPGDTSKTVTVLVNGDTKFEPTEDFTVTATETTNNQSDNGTGTITNDDSAPTVAVDDVTHSEGNSGTTAYVFTVSLSNASSQAITANVVTADGSAKVTDSDYTAVTTSVTFAPGDTSKTVTVLVNGDTKFEPTEDFTVTATETTNNQSDNGTGTITNDDSAPTVAVDDVEHNEGNSGTTAYVFTVSLSNASSQAITANVVTADGSATVADGDYTAVITSVTFAPGETTKTVTVSVNGDTKFEPTEEFTVTATETTNNQSDNGTGTITNDDAQPKVSVVSTSGGAEPSTPNVFTVTLSGTSSTAVSVDYATTSGTATQDVDYTGKSGTITFAADTTTLSQTISVDTLSDSTFEGTENFNLTLSNPNNTTIDTTVSPNPAIGTITDAQSQPTLSIVKTQGGAEKATNPQQDNVFTVTLSGSSASVVTVHYATSDLTATAGSDYTAASGDLTFAANSTGAALSQTVTVATLDDNLFEGTTVETFNLTLSAASNTTIPGTNPAIGTITDNETQPKLQFSSATYSASDSGTNSATITVTRDTTTATANAVSVQYATGGGTATGGASCTGGADYVTKSGTLNFASGVNSQTFTVQVCGDSLIEGNETVGLTLSNPMPTGVATLGTQNTATLTISDGAAGGTLMISGKVTPANGVADPNPGVIVTLSNGDTGAGMLTTTTDGDGKYMFTGLQSGNYLVTPSKSPYTFDPIERSVILGTTSVSGVDFTAYNTPIGRNLRIVNAYQQPSLASNVTVPIVLDSLGNENALSFSLNYDTSKLSNPVVACGNDAPGCTATPNTTGPAGTLGIAFDRDTPPNGPTVFTAGNGRQVVTVTFSTTPGTASNTQLTFGDNPVARDTNDVDGNSLATNYVNGFVVFAQGYEGDVAGRKTGNGILTSGDISVLRDFISGAQTPDPNFNEFQRADCAPAGSKGNGILTSGDLTVLRTYSSTQTLVSAGGPGQSIASMMAMPLRGSAMKSGSTFNLAAATGDVRVVNTTGYTTQSVTVPVTLDSNGTENGISFSIGFDKAKLSNPTISFGSDVPLGDSSNPALLTLNTTQVANNGLLGITVNLPQGQTFNGSGTKQVVRVTFNVAANAATGNTPITFGSTPQPQDLNNSAGDSLTANYFTGNVNILGPTAAGVTISGRLLTSLGKGVANGMVVLTDNRGMTQSARANAFGNFRFDGVTAGETYVISVSSKGYKFTPQVVSVTDSLTGVNLTANP